MFRRKTIEIPWVFQCLSMLPSKNIEILMNFNVFQGFLPKTLKNLKNFNGFYQKNWKPNGLKKMEKKKKYIYKKN